MSVKQWTEEELKKVNEEMEGKTPEEAVKWAVDNFGADLSLACSFGAEDVALVDMLVRIKPDARVFYLDTNYLFKETIEVKDRLAEKYNITFERFTSKVSVADMEAEHSADLWKSDANMCCQIRKITPLKEALSGLKAWITGIRRDQSPTRANAPIVTWDAMFELVKINPLVKWTSDDVWNYIRANDVPYCSLHDDNYPSIGCEPCTRKVMPGEDPRDGRWSGKEKTECGLHK